MTSAIDTALDALRRFVDEEVRSQLEDATRRDLSTVRPATPFVDARDIDFLRATNREMQEMRVLVRPLARALAARLARQQRRNQSGRVDVRRTIRTSLGSGGVPFDVAHRNRRRSKPELWLVCDISGSVAEFARFTLAFVTAMHKEFAGVRTFVFVDDIEEITELLDERLHDLDPFALLVRASADRHRRSDYGRMLGRLLDQHGDELTSRTTVLLTGDARSHDADPGVEHLRALRHRCRRVWFLDPEPRERWSQADAAVDRYAEVCDRVLEVRNLGQLASAIDELLI